MSLEGAGISLINAAYEEVAYFSIYCNPARWEVETKPDKWKALNMELSAILEDRWKCGVSQVSMEDAVEVNIVFDLFCSFKGFGLIPQKVNVHNVS